MAEFNFRKQYSGALACASVIATALCNIYIIIKIKYGQVLITKTTLKPYYLSLAYLLLSSVVLMLRYYLECSRDSKTIAIKYWNNVDGDNLVAVTRLLESITVVIFIYFIGVRINSCAVVYQFMVY